LQSLACGLLRKQLPGAAQHLRFDGPSLLEDWQGTNLQHYNTKKVEVKINDYNFMLMI
jgi:hypothetical protein